ncbi:MAG: hypothetical protein ABSH13_05490 [Candidatus Acidiferrum sp.]
MAVVAFLLGAVIGQPLLSLISSPKAEVGVQGLQMNYCMVYYVIFGHQGSIDSANFSVRFPSKLNGVKAGIAENVGGSDPEHEMRMVIGDLDSNACAMMSGGNALDTTGVTTSIVGNTLFERIGALSGNIPMSGMVIGPFNESAMTPAPTKPDFTGEYTYDLFGVTIRRPIKFKDLGVSKAKQ